MKKRRRKKPQVPRHTTQSPEKIIQTSSHGTQQQKEEPPKELEPKRLRSRIWQWWKDGWALLGPIVALVSFLYLWIPEISIEPSVNLDPMQPLATQFLVRNNGRVPIYNVRFGCILGGGNTYIGHLVIGPTLMPVQTLPAGLSVTRGCAVESSDITVPVITITVTYRWPLIGIQSVQTASFSLRHGVPGFFLVPEMPASP
jgi:hypothetical protein